MPVGTEINLGDSAIPCVICRGNSQLLLRKNCIPIQKCVECDHVFAHVEPSPSHVESVYGHDYFFGGKDGYPNYLEEAQLLERRGLRYARLVGQHIEPGILLDVGAAAGFLMKGFAREGWRCIGLEPNPEMAHYGAEELGLDIVQGTLETCDINQKFDLVNLIQVIAHLHDIPRALSNLTNLIRPGGALLVETWNQESHTARIFGKYWHEYSPPSVLHWFTPDRLTGLLQNYGFSKIAQGRMIKRISLRHAVSSASHVFGKSASSLIDKRIPASMSVPYPSEDLFWSLYGFNQ